MKNSTIQTTKSSNKRINKKGDIVSTVRTE